MSHRRVGSPGWPEAQRPPPRPGRPHPWTRILVIAEPPNRRWSESVLAIMALLMGILSMEGAMAALGIRLNVLNFVAYTSLSVSANQAMGSSGLAMAIGEVTRLLAAALRMPGIMAMLSKREAHV